MDRVRIRLLGPLSVTDADGRPVDLGGARLRALLAALALDTGGPVSAARLEALRANAREDLIEAGPAAGQGPGLLSDLRALAAEAPLRDRPRALLMRALHQAGRTAEARTVYEEGRALLADSLGADPSPLAGR
jgi:DNA-binding SARP family transcriptional activator